MVARDGPGPHSVQLYGVDPRTVGEAVRALVGEVGADHVDLNFGCPAPKVTRKGGGAALRPTGAAAAGGGRRRRTGGPGGVPVTVKFRMGLDAGWSTFLETGHIAEEEGVAAVALQRPHRRAALRRGRRLDAIALLKARVRSIPVLGNGDIWERPTRWR